MLLRLAALLAVPLLSTCSTQPVEPDAHGMADSGQADGGRDAGRDAGSDAGSDGGVTGWRRLTGLPEDCVVESATDPAAELSLNWRACDDAVGDCWVTGPLFPDPSWIFDGSSDGTQGYVAFAYEDPRERQVAVLVSTLDGAKGLWRATAPGADARICLVGAVAAGEGHGSFTVIYSDGRARERSIDAVFHAPIDQLPAALAPTAVVTGDIAAGGGPQRPAVTAQLVALEWQPGGIIYVIDADGSQYALFDDPVVGTPQNPSAVGGDVFWEDWSTSVRLAHASRERAPYFFRDIAPDDVKHYETDGLEHVWLEGRGAQPGLGYESLTLMTAPYTASADEIEPRVVASLDNQWPSTFGGGWYAFRRPDPPRLEVIRTADGTRRTWLPPPEHDLLSRAPLYASDHEVMVHTQRDGLDYLIRIDPHTLPRSD